MSTITNPIEETEIEEPVVLDELDELLLKMENYIREHGWVQNTAWANDGRVCMIGAIYATMFGIESSEAFAHVPHTTIMRVNTLAQDIVERINNKTCGTPYSRFVSLSDYNDNIAQSVDDIYNTLRIARKK